MIVKIKRFAEAKAAERRIIPSQHYAKLVGHRKPAYLCGIPRAEWNGKLWRKYCRATLERVTCVGKKTVRKIPYFRVVSPCDGFTAEIPYYAVEDFVEISAEEKALLEKVFEECAFERLPRGQSHRPKTYLPKSHRRGRPPSRPTADNHTDDPSTSRPDRLADATPNIDVPVDLC